MSTDSTFLSNQDNNEYNVENQRVYKTTLLYKIKIFFKKLWQGPAEPKDEYAPRLTYFNFLETIPDKFHERVAPIYKKFLLITYLIFWFGLVYSILIPYFTVPPHVTSGTDIKEIYSLSCSSQDEFWKGKNGACGLNGELCPEILKHEQNDIYIRCPALCDRGSWTYSLIPIGDQRIKYRGYFVGGGREVENKIEKDQLTNPYRADSYPCGAAVHAGLVSPVWGGCAKLSYKSNGQPYFKSTKGHYGVRKSIEFLSFFKSSFFFKKLKSDNEIFSQCYDPRFSVLIINIILGIPIVYLASGVVTYWVINIVGFWTICLATDPPVNIDANDPEDFANLLSIGLERFLPSCCILYVLWHFSTERTLSEPPANSNEKVSYLSRLILWYPLFWLGILNNMTFDRLPVDRLTIDDLKVQSGAIFAVGSIILTITTCAIIQAYKIWLSGRFRKYLLLYSTFTLGLVLLGNLPNLTLRVHHYILAMLLIPGCATKGRTALMFQGILLGLFLSGASRWGLAAIAETATSLLRNDPQGKTVSPPLITNYDNNSGILSWMSISPANGTNNQEKLLSKYSEISLLINDIESFTNKSIDQLNLKQILDKLPIVQDTLNNGIKDSSGDISIYLRLGRKIPNTKFYSDFSNAATLKWPSGKLTLPVPGLT
ncbi:unnamed protein product [Candida verbasci]|uniref:LCCL domain-containing protein n=1 Tax=Candida verbasci TaxID=1227364 RepID=A0A9W4XFB0_9ASCO|nr:unnamed protein product [Candida verbasci]